MTVRFADSAQRAVLCGQCNVHSAEAIACELWARSEHAHVTTCHVVGASKISTSAITASMEIEASGGDRGKWSNFSYVGILKGSFSLRSDTLAPATLSRGRFLYAGIVEIEFKCKNDEDADRIGIGNVQNFRCNETSNMTEFATPRPAPRPHVHGHLAFCVRPPRRHPMVELLAHWY